MTQRYPISPFRNNATRCPNEIYNGRINRVGASILLDSWHKRNIHGALRQNPESRYRVVIHQTENPAIVIHFARSTVTSLNHYSAMSDEAAKATRWWCTLLFIIIGTYTDLRLWNAGIGPNYNSPINSSEFRLDSRYGIRWSGKERKITNWHVTSWRT